MRVARVLKWLLVAVVLVVAAAATWLYVQPPALIRVGTGYSAKIVCSNVFLAGRDGQEVLALDVQSPGHPLLGYITASVDREAGRVRAALLGLFAAQVAIHREGLGCSLVPDGDVAAAEMPLPPPLAPNADAAAALWPQGESVAPDTETALADLLDSPQMRGPEMRAIVVAHRGRIVAERYGAGFDARTPLLGWSMSKSVTAAIIGTLVREGRMSLEQDRLFDLWAGDDRASISVADLLAMSSGLVFNEDYGDVTDVTRMLYLEPDMASFAADKPLLGDVGATFSYSSGTTVLLSRIWQDAVGDEVEAVAWPNEQLFGQIGMYSAVQEVDARGTLAGSSYIYATARDWARFGQFLLQDGVWDGRQILPEGFVDWMREPAPTNRYYGRGHVWLQGPRADGPRGQPTDAGFELPQDTFWLSGHDGQTVAIIPSRDLVVVRMGLTPSRLGYKPQGLLEALLDMLPQ